MEERTRDAAPYPGAGQVPVIGAPAPSDCKSCRMRSASIIVPRASNRQRFEKMLLRRHTRSPYSLQSPVSGQREAQFVCDWLLRAASSASSR